MSRCSDLLLTSLAGGLGGGSPSQRGARGAAPARMRQGTPSAPAIALTLILTLRQLTVGQKYNIFVSAKYCIAHLLALPTRTLCRRHANAHDCCLRQSRT